MNVKDSSSLEHYHRLRHSGRTPGVQIILSALKECRSLAACKALHLDLADEHGKVPDVYVANTLLSMYCRCGSVSEARSVFDRINKRTIVSWNAMIKGYADNGENKMALQLFNDMQAENFTPNHITFIGVIKACGNLAVLEDGKKVDGMYNVKLGCLEKGRVFHTQAEEMGLGEHVYVSNCLLDFYFRCGSIFDARRVFDRIKHHSVVSWTALISGYAENGYGYTALDLLARMQDDGVSPNYVTCLAALKACAGALTREEEQRKSEGKASSLQNTRAVHLLIVKNGFEVEGFLANALVDTYRKVGSMTRALGVFDGMYGRDTVCWNSIILGYVECNKGACALQTYRRMQHERCSRNRVSYMAALKACGSLASKETLQCSDAYGGKLIKVTSLQLGRDIHSDIRDSGLEQDSHVASSLVDMYSKCGSMTDARRVFDGMKVHDVVSWTAIILGYAESGDGDQAMNFFTRMKSESCSPNHVTFIGALKACATLGALQTGKEVHVEIRTAGLETEPLVATALLDFYGRCGSVEDSEQVFDSITSKDLAVWNALLAAYSRHGYVDRVFGLFERMKTHERLHPDGVTYVPVLAACSHRGLVERGKRYFREMTDEHGITPDAGHFNCMVDLLARANRFDEAAEMLRSVPFQPGVTMWITLLAASRKWKNVKVGQLAFENVVKLDRGNSGAYISMADIYADAGMWEESQRIRSMMKKANGLSLNRGGKAR